MVYDTKHTELKASDAKVTLTHIADMHYNEASGKEFTKSMISGKEWNVTDLSDGGTETIKFNDDGTITEITGYQQGLTDNYVWQINDKDELETIFYLYGVPITTYTYKIVENKGEGCYIVDYTFSGDWYKQFRMCPISD